jgi:hypothetical protein
MKIELKRLNINLQLSQETILFAADLHIDGVMCGHARNEGHGGNTHYSGFDLPSRELIKKAEDWCKAQPDMDVPEYGFTLPMTLELAIDNLVDAEIKRKEEVRFKKKMERDMQKAIIIGPPATLDVYWTIKLSYPIATSLGHPFSKEALKNTIQRIRTKHAKLLSEGNVILNTNIPAEILGEVAV